MVGTALAAAALAVIAISSYPGNGSVTTDTVTYRDAARVTTDAAPAVASVSDAAAVQGPAYTPHEWHELHLAHLAHLAALKAQAAAAAYAKAHPAPAPVTADVVHAAVAAPVSDTSVQATSSFEACVIRAESGGNAQIWNASGHYGLFQFSASTWDAAGGDPGMFGHASAGYQVSVFWKAYDLWGTSPWAPYDGCS